MLSENGFASHSSKPAVDNHGSHSNYSYTDLIGSSFTSAVRHATTYAETRPIFRRRGSESNALARMDHIPWDTQPLKTTHLRSRTLDVAGSSTSLHPLANGASLSTISGRFSSHDTRPHMKRMLTDLATPSLPLSETVVNTDPQRTRNEPVREDETVVLVHEVSPRDSLAGVALKYGITLADLRRANQLWASDSIHLRKVLYIPLDKSRHAKQLRASQLDVDDTPSISLDSSTSNITMGAEHTQNSQCRDIDSQQFTIRRVPTSQLTFFPPSSSFDASSDSSHTRTLHRSNPTRPHTYTDIPPSSFSNHLLPQRYSKLLSPPGPALSFILNALPIPPSTRDAFGIRRSLDSGRSTPLQAGEEQEHELTDVSAASSLERDDRHHLSVDFPQSSSSTIAQIDGITALELDTYPSLFSSSAHPPIRRRKNSHLASISESRSSSTALHRASTIYASVEHSEDKSRLKAGVRTAQLEPSPIMQLPFQTRRSKP